MKLTCRHLAKVGRRYCFRIVIPERLRHHFGRREIKKALRTENPVAAATLAIAMSARVRALMDQAIEEGEVMDATMAARIRKFVRAYVRDVLDTDEQINAFGNIKPDDLPRMQTIIVAGNGMHMSGVFVFVLRCVYLAGNAARQLGERGSGPRIAEKV